MKIVLNDLYDYDGLKIYQDENGFKFSLDSILLAEYVKLNNRTKNILDLCTGNGAIPLILSTKTKAQIDAFEIQTDVFDLAEKSVKVNNCEKQIRLFNANIIDIDNYLKGKKYDIITCNPPYFKIHENSNITKSDSLAIARHELTVSLEEIFYIASRYLNDGGEFYLVHRASRLDEIIINGYKNHLNVKNISLINTKKEGLPYIALVRCIKNSKEGVIINNPIFIGDEITYKNLFKEEL